MKRQDMSPGLHVAAKVGYNDWREGYLLADRPLREIPKRVTAPKTPDNRMGVVTRMVWEWGGNAYPVLYAPRDGGTALAHSVPAVHIVPWEDHCAKRAGAERIAKERAAAKQANIEAMLERCAQLPLNPDQTRRLAEVPDWSNKGVVACWNQLTMTIGDLERFAAAVRAEGGL